MDNFLQLLEDLNASSLPDSLETILNDQTNRDIHLLVAYATTHLIDDKGNPNVDNHTILREKGFDVFPGEIDRFGWLTGCIQTKKGIVVFG
jgi:hypothetical protein